MGTGTGMGTGTHTGTGTGMGSHTGTGTTGGSAVGGATANRVVRSLLSLLCKGNSSAIVRGKTTAHPSSALQLEVLHVPA